jgi:predicted site-specific integrase-resolvase
MLVTSTIADRLWTFEDVAHFFHISVNTARMWHREGQIPRGRKRGRRWYWRPSEIQGIDDPAQQQNAEVLAAAGK